ncbi:MAG: hypothetical protein P1U68_08155 [Verrucomicrobiales bacterium]|nr:hypothetical protein [Verrucomicrobiales bacterium]
MKNSLFRLGLIFFLSPVFGQVSVAPSGSAPTDKPSEELSDHIRYIEGPEADRLQTAVTRFQRGDDLVDLVSVVHLADATYYENLNRLLSGYDVVLYEMVGGAFSPESAEAAESGNDEMTAVRQLQTMAKSFLGLEFQLEGIDYSASNFVHADAGWDLMSGLMEARNQNFSEIFTRAMALSQEGSIAGLPDTEADMNFMLGSLLTAVTTGDSNALKRLIAPFLSEAEGFITQLEGEDGTVLVTERNKLVMAKLSEEQASHGAGKYAVFYGAGHMPDLESRLIDEGYTKVETVWADAWTMGDGGSDSTSAPAVAPADFFLNLLEENPEIMGTIQKMGEMLEQLQTIE